MSSSFADASQLLRNIHPVFFSIEQGTVTALLGPNGAGKSTAIGMVGLRVPLAGARGYVLKEGTTRKLHLSEGTVRNYVSDIIAKLKVQSRQEAVRKAQENGWL